MLLYICCEGLDIKKVRPTLTYANMSYILYISYIAQLILLQYTFISKNPVIYFLLNTDNFLLRTSVLSEFTNVQN